MQRFKFGPILLVAAMVIGARPAHAQTTLTFDANACSGMSSGSAGPTYIESGFMLSVTGPTANSYGTGAPLMSIIRAVRPYSNKIRATV